MSIPEASPLRRAHPLFWGIRFNDEGAGRANGFYNLVNKGKINIISPVRALAFGTNRKSVVLSDGRFVETDAIVLGTGFKSSWGQIFDRMFHGSRGAPVANTKVSTQRLQEQSWGWINIPQWRRQNPRITDGTILALKILLQLAQRMCSGPRLCIEP